MAARGFSTLTVLAGIVLVGLGVVFILAEADIIEIKFQYVAPVVLILVGLFVLARGFQPGATWRKQEVDDDGTFASMRPRRPTRSD
ncbi:MAG TPA: hypothetical protein VHJ82_09590 [Actinomycetota bacterium]|nr:hypothetical protein [Actinomycetota bacterium]